MAAGFARARRFGPELAAAGCAAIAALYVAGDSFGRGVPLDDAWIHLVYGRALRTSASLAYNDGVPSTGCTSPLWCCFAALADALGGTRGPALAAATWLKSFATAAHVAASVVATRLARACMPSPRSAWPGALLAGLLVGGAPWLAYAAVSGMEVTFTAALLLGAFLAAARSRPLLASALIGLAVAARPESLVVLPFVLVVAFARSRARWRLVVAAGGLAMSLAPTALLVARSIHVSRRPLPATFYAKADTAQPFLHALATGFDEVLAGVVPQPAGIFWVLVLAGVGLGGACIVRGALARRQLCSVLASRPVLVASIGLAGVAFLAGCFVVTRMRLPHAFYFVRYALPGVPMAIVTAVAALFDVAHRVRARMPPMSAPLVGAAACVALWVGLPDRRAAYANDVADIGDVQVAVGGYIDSALPRDAVVWTVDAGAIRYFGRRRTIDLMGLNTAESIHECKVRKNLWPDSIVIVPSIFQIRAPDWLLTTAFTAQTRSSASAGVPAEKSWGAQRVLRCNHADAKDPENKVVVIAGPQLLAVGRCVRRD